MSKIVSIQLSIRHNQYVISRQPPLYQKAHSVMRGIIRLPTPVPIIPMPAANALLFLVCCCTQTAPESIRKPKPRPDKKKLPHGCWDKRIYVIPKIQFSIVFNCST